MKRSNVDSWFHRRTTREDLRKFSVLHLHAKACAWLTCRALKKDELCAYDQ